MSNRKTKRSRKGPARAPRDGSSFEDGVPETPSRGIWGYALLGLKVVTGLGLLAAAAFALAWGVHRYAQTTPRFAINQIEIEGTKRLMREDVLGAAGLSTGQNLFTLDIEKAERSLVDSPWISSAQVTRRLPGTVRVSVVERDPRAIAVISGKNFLVASDGTPFKQMGFGDPHDLPLITGVSAEALARDRRAEIARLVEALGLFQAYEKLSIAKTYPSQEAHLSETGSVTLVVGEVGVTLHLGPGPFKRKLLRAERALEKTRREGGNPEVVFLDNAAHPEKVVVRVQ